MAAQVAMAVMPSVQQIVEQAALVEMAAILAVPALLHLRQVVQAQFHY
jgi:hypothetical protein